MSEPIDRQTAIDAIRASASKYTGFMEKEMYTDDDAVKAIEAVPTVSPWHMVEETPKLDELVPNRFYASTMLVMFCNGGYYIGYALSDEKNGPVRWVNDGMTISPTHWMPIEPPKEDA